MVKRKLNVKRVVIAVLIFIILVLILVYFALNRIKMINSIEYKLSLNGFSESEIEILKNVLSEEELNDFYLKKYDNTVIDYVKADHFMYDKLEDYLNYNNKKTNYSTDKIVTIVNVHADEEDYENVNYVNTELGSLILVNKNNVLDSDFVPNNIIDVEESYAYKGVSISEDVYNAFLKLLESAKNSGYTLVASSGYRSYEEQEKVYNEYKSLYGRYEADKLVAHPGCSDHQTGLAIEIEPFDKAPEDIEANEEYNWLINNAYKFGFIQRYPKDKEYITKFDYEPWHFRYVGLDAAYKMHNENLTLEEYYYYYVVN